MVVRTAFALFVVAVFAWYLGSNSRCHPMPPRNDGDTQVYMCLLNLADPLTKQAWWKEPELVYWY